MAAPFVRDKLELPRGKNRLALHSCCAPCSGGNAFFDRPGPRLVESLEIMAECADPSRFADVADEHREAIRAWSARP